MGQKLSHFSFTSLRMWMLCTSFGYKITLYSVCVVPLDNFIKDVYLCFTAEKQNAIKFSLKYISTGALLFSQHKINSL